MKSSHTTAAARVEAVPVEEERGRPALSVVDGGRSDAVPTPIFDDGWALVSDGKGEGAPRGRPTSQESFWRRLALWWRRTDGSRAP